MENQRSVRHGRYEGVLRLLSDKYTFVSVKWFLLPTNVTLKTQVVDIAEVGKGNHFVLTELMLTTDNVVLYDWFGDHKSTVFYKDITGDFLALCATLQHTLTRPVHTPQTLCFPSCPSCISDVRASSHPLVMGTTMYSLFVFWSATADTCIR